MFSDNWTEPRYTSDQRAKHGRLFPPSLFYLAEPVFVVVEVIQRRVKLGLDPGQTLVIFGTHILTLHVFCYFDKPLVVLILVYGYEPLVDKIFETG